MCSINGFNFQDKDLIIEMNKATKHRGPDGSDVFVDENISFGHNLLAITEDPSNSIQPFVSEDNGYVLVYNGEIYNYRKLRKELESNGSKFKTDGDTEVLFQGLIKEGIDFIEKIDGMFAFGFFDRKKGKIFLARDFSGIKPIYYYDNDSKFIFSSELRGVFAYDKIERKLNMEMLNIYFGLGYTPGEKTMIKNVNKVCPGQILIYNLKDKVLEKKWFGKSYRKEMKVEYQSDRFREMMGRSVKAHTMGRRKYGLYLSGGLDSTLILHELSKFDRSLIKTYTTRFDIDDENINEDADGARKLCEEYKIDHTELLITEDDFIYSIEKTIATIEEPRYNFSLAAYWLLAEKASRDVTVILSGSGGDEVFLGYIKYLETRLVNKQYQKYPQVLVDLWKTASSLRRGKIKIGQIIQLQKTLNQWAYFNNVVRLSPQETKKAFKFDTTFSYYDILKFVQDYDSPVITSPLNDRENSFAEMDRLFWLADEDLLRSDKITMGFGMEARFPFLSKEVINFANNFPAKEKITDVQTKILVRDAYKDQLPDYIIDKEKTGWYAPAVKWMNSKFGDFVSEVLSDEYYPETASLFDLDYIRKEFIDNVEKFDNKSVKKFFPILFFQIWAKQFNIKL